MGKTAFHLATEWDKLDLLKKIWEWAKETITTDEVNNKLLFGTDNMEMTAWHKAIGWGNQKFYNKCADGLIAIELIALNSLNYNINCCVWRKYVH